MDDLLLSLLFIKVSLRAPRASIDRQVDQPIDERHYAIFRPFISGRSVTLVHIINNKAKTNKDPAFHHERTRPGKSVTILALGYKSFNEPAKDTTDDNSHMDMSHKTA